jgi:hypothetical protein
MAGGPLTRRETEVIGDYVVKRGFKVSTRQADRLARRLHRTPRSVRRFIRGVRTAFLMRAPEYVERYHQLIEQVIAAGPKCRSYGAALRSIQWALQAMGVVKPPTTEAGRSGVKIIVGGVNVSSGGHRDPTDADRYR